MEATLNKLSAEDPAIKEEQRAESDSVDDTEKMLLFQVGNRNMHNASKPAVPSNRNNLRIMNQVDQLESAKSKMSAVNEENERLKMMIDRVVKEHRSLQTHMLDIVKQEQAKTLAHVNSPESEDPRHRFLGLGRSPSIIKDENKGLVPGLESKFTVSQSFRTKDDESRTGLRRLGSEEGELPEQKKTRVSVRVRCDGATMNDGCQWRKYGQKISKGNPCPRAYYRCTVGPTCPVRKQVQRCAEDMSILTTTYEGTHNHQLPMSATAMASSTSAAAYMIRSGSTSSNQVPGSSSLVFPGLNYNHLPNQNNALPQFYTPAPLFSSLSSHPTITLDLTNSPPSSSLFPPYLHNTPSAPASFNFSSHRDQVPYDKNRPLGYVNHGRQNQLPVQQSLSTSSSNQTIAAATKAITSHPSFQMALEAAITSFIGGGAKRIRDGEDNSMGMLMKRSESLPVNTSTTIDWNHISSSSSEGRERSLMFLPPPSLPSSSTKRGSESPPEDKKHKL